MNAIHLGTRRRLLGAALCACATLAFSGALLAKGTTHTIVMDGVKYTPANLTVKVGDRVTWVNKDPFPHTATSPGHFDSKDIPADGKWTYVAKKAGTYDYICIYHPNMKGTLKVE